MNDGRGGMTRPFELVGMPGVDKLPIDILAGSDSLRRQIESDVSPTEIAASWSDDEQAFEKIRRKFLLYQ